MYRPFTSEIITISNEEGPARMITSSPLHDNPTLVESPSLARGRNTVRVGVKVGR